MKPKEISVTEAICTFESCMARVQYDNVTFVLLMKGVPVARLVPYREKICSGRELAEALKKVRLSPRVAQRWRQDFAKSRKKLASPSDKWR